jgi:DNA processing protein
VTGTGPGASAGARFLASAAEPDRLARAVLGYLTQPGDVSLGALLRYRSATEVVTALLAGQHPLPAGPRGSGRRPRTTSQLPPGPGLFGEAEVDQSGSAEFSTPGTVSTSGSDVDVAGFDAREPATPGNGTDPDRPDGRSRFPEIGASRDIRLRDLDRAVARWLARASQIPAVCELAAGQLAISEPGLRLVIPGDPEWPTQLDDLGDGAPVALWANGQADLRFACLRSVSLVGSRAATPYGLHLTTDLAATLAERGCTVVSGGAMGIDAAAHRGALAVSGTTVAVLASGLHYGYPRSHAGLFEEIADRGVLVSERPPDHRPNRPGFLIRNRVIAALSRGTVVIEAALRSGALATATQAVTLRRPLMAVPGPVTSVQSAGCHMIIRDTSAVLVTSAADVLEMISPIGQDLAPPQHSAVVPHDELDPVTKSVLEAVPARRGSGPAAIAATAGTSLDTVIRCLGALAAAGFVERSPQGWRIRKHR